MKLLKSVFLFVFVVLLVSCTDNTLNKATDCSDHVSGYDEVCGCPDEEVGFAGWCINKERRDLVYYVAELNFYCLPDSMAIGVETLEGILDVSLNFNEPSPSIGSYGDIPFRNQLIVGSYQGCENIPNINSSASTFFILQNPELVEDLPDEITLKLLHKEGPALSFETIDSVNVVLYRDSERL